MTYYRKPVAPKDYTPPGRVGEDMAAVMPPNYRRFSEDDDETELDDETDDDEE